MGDNNNRVILISTATGPNNSKRRVRAYVGRSTETWAPPGVVFLPGAPGNVSMSNFEGQSFRIDGGDHIPDNNTPGSGPKPSIPAIGTTNSSLTSNIVSWLANNQYNQIVGQGSDPSIVTTTSTIDVNQLATNLINLGVEGVDKQTLSPGVYDDGDWGTATSPKITHITGVGELQLIGNLKGYGVLITDLDVDVHIAGNFKWYGLMITRRHAHFNPNHFGAAPGGQSQLWGNIFIPENSLAKIDIGDQAKLRYSSRAFNDYAFTRWPSAFPKPAKIIAWQELMS